MEDDDARAVAFGQIRRDPVELHQLAHAIFYTRPRSSRELEAQDRSSVRDVRTVQIAANSGGAEEGPESGHERRSQPLIAFNNDPFGNLRGP
jgi:hypothetical protein